MLVATSEVKLGGSGGEGDLDQWGLPYQVYTTASSVLGKESTDIKVTQKVPRFHALGFRKKHWSSQLSRENS